MKQSLAKAGLIVMFLNGAAIVAAFVREATIAYYYGASAELDAFWVALSVPRFVGESLVVATVTALIPVFAKIRAKEGEEAMVRKASNLASVNLVGLAVFVGGYVIAAPFVVKALAPGFESYRHNLAVRLTVLLAPITLLWGALGILKALHNTYRRFTYPELARVLLSFGIVAALVVFASRYGIYAMVAGFIGGLGLALLLNTAPLSRLRKMLRLRLDFRAPEVRRYLAMLLPVLATSGVYYIHVLVDNIFASGLEFGSVSALRYASVIVAVPVTLIGGAMATVIYPTFADLWAQGRKEELKRTSVKGLRITFFLALPTTVVLITNSKSIVKIVFERGKFTPESSSLCAVLLSIYSFRLVLNMSGGLFSRFFAAMRQMWFLLLVTLLGVASNIALNFMLTPLYGVKGIALATVLRGVITFPVWTIAFSLAASVKIRDFIFVVMRPLIISTLVALTGWLCATSFAHFQSVLLRLMLTITLELIVFVFASVKISSDDFRFLVRLISIFGPRKSYPRKGKRG